MASKSREELFRAKIAIDDTGCHVWTAAKDKDGYGQFRDGDRVRQAHIWAWEQANSGPLPEGYEVDHQCRNRACVNAQHLELVTHAENMRRQREAQERLARDDDDASERTLQRRRKKQQTNSSAALGEMLAAVEAAAILGLGLCTAEEAARFVMIGHETDDEQISKIAALAKSKEMEPYREGNVVALAKITTGATIAAAAHAWKSTPIVPPQCSANHLRMIYEVREKSGGADASFTEIHNHYTVKVAE